MNVNGFSDQELSLIPGNQSSKSIINPVARCFLIKLLPLIIFFFLSLFGAEDSVNAVITLILVFLEFMFIKYISGFNLVGLKWSINLSSFSFSWYSKPEPFVPVLSNTNFFWMSFFIFLIVWLICFFIAFFSSTKTKAFTSLIGFICEGINLYMFSKAHNYAKKQVEKEVLNSIQEEVHFDLVPENDPEANDKEVMNDNQDNKGKDNYFLPKKTSKVLDTTSVELPPPLMPTSHNSENKVKSDESKEQATSVSDHENETVPDSNENNDNDKNEEDDIDFY